MKSRIMLLTKVMHDLRDVHGQAILPKDLLEIQSRYDKRGFPFLASDLPLLDDALLTGLASRLPTIPGWKRVSKKDRRPQFLIKLWSEIFDADGYPIDNPSHHSIFAIRQISRLFKKVFEVCSDDKVDAEILAFKRIDSESPTSIPFGDELARVSAILHGRALFSISRKEELDGSHGPGATAEGLDSIERWDFPSISRTQASRFDISDFFMGFHEDFPCDIIDQTGRLVAVPKDFNKPRLISIEPASAMFSQQSILRQLDNWMGTISQLNMRDQSRNRSLARIGSADGSLATIDLSSASDRLSLALYEAVFKLSPAFSQLCLDVRTPAVTTPSGELIVLNKFASMGCALTFPIQMLVYRTIVIWALVKAEGRDLTYNNVMRWSRSSQVGFFGDDIIVPGEFAQPVMRALEVFGLKVNTSKSFHTGLFRESCGGDYYAGKPVNPVYVRRQPPHSRRDVAQMLSWAAMSHLLDEAHLPESAAFVSDLVQDLIGPAPHAEAAISVSHPRSHRTRYNHRLQRHEVWGVTTRPRRPRSNAGDYAKLAKAIASAGQEVIDPLRLTHHGRPSGAFITRRWVAAY